MSIEQKQIHEKHSGAGKYVKVNFRLGVFVVVTQKIIMKHFGSRETKIYFLYFINCYLH